jgi:hypothetical protein
LDPDRHGVDGGWFGIALADSIELPGSCEQRGFGVRTTEAAVGRLTRVIHYEGPAWYQRDIDVPETWRGKRVELFLERCHWETSTWIGDRHAGAQNSLSTPHIYDLGVLRPGRHRLTICVDNAYKIPIGRWTSAITEDTQGNWNGIIGRIELRATDLVWVRGGQVYLARVKVSIGNQTGRAVDGTINQMPVRIPAGGVEVELPLPHSVPRWDEFSPTMHELTLTLDADRWHDTYIVRYGIRDLSTRERQFTLNGRPILLRGPVEECVFPLTGYPPTHAAEWRRILRICKSHGFNFLRFHSWCPPEAAFVAGDELGFLFQVELPIWTMDAPHFGQHAVRDRFIRDGMDRILETYGNHPSFALMAMGNESTGALDALVKAGRAKDPRRLYRCENGDTPDKGDFHETGERGVAGPRTDWDRTTAPRWIVGSDDNATDHYVAPQVPIFSHEVGQWAMYPDFREIAKYTGTTRAHNIESYRRSLAEHHMLDQAEAFRQASGKLSILLYKEEIEASLRTWPYGGFQVLEARDYPGQGTALVGWLDAFWDSKGLIAPEQFRRFCGPTVCLLRMPRRVWTVDDKFTAITDIAHCGPAAIDVTPKWSVCIDGGTSVAHGELPRRRIETGQLTPLGDVQFALSSVPAPARLTVTLTAGDNSNSWNIWVYPAVQPAPLENVRIVHEFNEATIDALSAGERVVLFSSPRVGRHEIPRVFLPADDVRLLPPARPGANALPGSFTPVFWNTRLFNQIGTMGILCDPAHPALAGFPTDSHSDWQWADLLGRFSAADSFRAAGAPPKMYQAFEAFAADVTDRSKAIILDDTPPDFRPIVQVIDNYDRNLKLGVIFECRIGPGRLLVCAMDLETDADKRPAARQLKASLLAYAAGERFSPSHELSVDVLRRLTT